MDKEKAKSPIQISGDLKHPSVSSDFKIDPLKNQVSWNINWSDNVPSQSSQSSQTEQKKKDGYHVEIDANSLKNITEPSSTPSWNSGGTSSLLPEERKKATFPVQELTYVLYGGPQGVAKRKFIMSPTEGLDMSDIYNWERPKLMEQHVKNFLNVHEAFWDNYRPTREEVNWMTEVSMIKGTLMNHYGLFLPTIAMQASAEQIEWWLNRTLQMKMIGSYAQTELGHGSNVRGLQTTATFDKSTKEFVLNTPTLQSMKWWPGTLGKVATHAIVYAQLIIDGKEYGLHAFMLQIRNEEHKPFEGIELGDVGNKLGDNANDTGYMRLKNVRVPHKFMLSRYQHVTDDGEYVVSEQKKKNQKLHYATMMMARASMIQGSASMLARASTIAIRYSCVRRQGFADPTTATSHLSEEKPIIDYQVQRFRLLKQLSLTFAIRFSGKWMFDLLRPVDNKDANADLSKLENLGELAATSAGLKALSTFLVTEGIEDCRKACGGNGYLLNSGVAANAADYVWQTTAEGDYILLMLLTGRFLLKMLRNAKEGKPVTGPVSYLSPLKDGNFEPIQACPKPAKDSAQWSDDHEYLLSWYAYRALYLVNKVGTRFATMTMTGSPFMEAWNECSLELVDAVRAHCCYVLLSHFVSTVKNIQHEAVKKVLAEVCSFFALSQIIDQPWNGLIGVDQMELVKEAGNSLLNRLRPNCVALVDSFDIPDRVLNSTLGAYDGNVYERLYESARRSTLNLKDPFDGYHDYLRPRLDLEFLKKGNKIPSKL